MDDFDGVDEPKEGKAAWVLSALSKAEDAFREWENTCQTIDEIYNECGGKDRITSFDGITDNKLDLFWSSYEILKPAVYAKAPQPVVSPIFADNNLLYTTTAEMLERVTVSTFKRTCIDDVMRQLRDDVIFDGRGVPWVRYETDDGQKVVPIHKDRCDFLHEPARYWSEVGWVASAEHLDKDAMKKRFKLNDEKLDQCAFTKERDEAGRYTGIRKCKVWEFWHKGKEKVYWVTEGYDDFLDESAPYLKLSGFWPTPRPAYGTLARRSLIPSPDYLRFADHFHQINKLTKRIYVLLERVKMKGLIPAGGDVATAVHQLMASNDEQLLIGVPGMALGTSGSSAVVWLPLAEIATAIQGLIQARAQLIDDFYQLSGISDIMRGATEADETLGAQQLKSQYGSVRVREKVQELQRVAADVVAIAAEIIAENFSKETLLEMSQMEIPSKADITKRVRFIEKSGDEELDALLEKFQEEKDKVDPEQADPAMAQQAEQAFQQAQQQIVQKYSMMLQEANSLVPIEDIMKLLRDDRARSFTFEIESSSTIMTDELQEKQSRNEFVEVFTASSQAMMGLAALGEPGAKLAGALMKFQLAPYRAGRDLNSVIDEFIDAAPEMAKQAQAANGQEGEAEGLVEAQKGLAEAEKLKAQAAMTGVQAKAEFDKAELQRKMAQMQLDAQKQQNAAQEAQAKLMLQLQKQEQEGLAKDAKTQAEIDLMRANIAKILSSIGLDERKQELSEYTAASNEQSKRVDQAMAIEGQQTEATFRAEDAERASRGEERADRQQDFNERSGDRQMSLAEQQAQREGNE